MERYEKKLKIKFLPVFFMDGVNSRREKWGFLRKKKHIINDESEYKVTVIPL
jgi:hypothetical protein